MVYDELKVVLAILVIILALVLLAIVNSEPSRTEREEAVGLRCWHEEWADVREAQDDYLERRGE